MSSETIENANKKSTYSIAVRFIVEEAILGHALQNKTQSIKLSNYYTDFVCFGFVFLSNQPIISINQSLFKTPGHITVILINNHFWRTSIFENLSITKRVLTKKIL